MARILVVEDEPTIAMGLRDDLELEGHVVDVVTDGEAAEAAAMTATHDLIVLDVMLPKQDGLSVCRKVRAAGVRTPIILLTARGLEQDKVRGLQLGADDYVTKPFSPRELAARIDAVLRRSAPSPASPQIYTIGNLTIDFGRYEATREQQRIELTALVQADTCIPETSRAGDCARFADCRCLGPRRLSHRSRHLHPYQQPAPEDRGNAEQAAVDRERARRRLSLRRLTHLEGSLTCA